MRDGDEIYMERKSKNFGMMGENLERAISYFKKHTVYGKLFTAMREKYAIRGQLCGTFTLENLTLEERNTLSGFLGVAPGKDKTVKISYVALCRALKKSRFCELCWEEILTGYTRKPLVSNKEERLRKKETQDIFTQECLALCTKEDVKEWLWELLCEKQSGYRTIEKALKTDREETKRLLKNVIYGLEHLPVDEGKKKTMPVYAAEMTGNPHYFDDGTPACRLLLNFGERCVGQSAGKLSGVEQRESVLYRLGILKDDLSNLCLAYGVTGVKTDGRRHEGLYGFCEEKQAVQMTLNMLGGLACLKTAQSGRSIVYIIENPAVFSYLIKKYPKDTFLCTTGQLKLAGYVAMDLFPREYTFYYAGDFDPEGLQIAQGLKKRYGERLFLWNYKKEYYKQAVSQLALDMNRLKKLDKIDLAELEEIKNCLLTYGKAAYQEKMLETYVIKC